MIYGSIKYITAKHLPSKEIFGGMNEWSITNSQAATVQQGDARRHKTLFSRALVDYYFLLSNTGF